MAYWPSYVEEELEKLFLRLHPPKVTFDNDSDTRATLIKVDSRNKRGSLLQVVQVLTDLNLIIRRAYISSDGSWFMDVFHVTDEQGYKLSEDSVTDRIEQSLRPRGGSIWSSKGSVGVESAMEHTTVELIGRDRPGLLSEVFAVLSDLKCNVVAAEAWTHNARMGSVIYICDESNGLPINDPHRIAQIEQLLLYVLKAGDRDKRDANTSISKGCTHMGRRLHQMMYADRDYDMNEMSGFQIEQSKPHVDVVVENCVEKRYTRVNLRCPDRPKLLFDTVCTLTDMEYMVYQGTVIAEGPEAYQEYYIRHLDDCPISSEAERQRVVHCLEAAINRRTSEGVKLELRSEDKVGLLSHVTRIFRENGLCVTRAEVTTRGSQVMNIFYVMDASGGSVKSETIEAVRKEIG